MIHERLGRLGRLVSGRWAAQPDDHNNGKRTLIGCAGGNSQYLGRFIIIYSSRSAHALQYKYTINSSRKMLFLGLPLYVKAIQTKSDGVMQMEVDKVAEEKANMMVKIPNE